MEALNENAEEDAEGRVVLVLLRELGHSRQRGMPDLPQPEARVTRMPKMKALPSNVNTERQALLERYLHAWLTSHALTLGDLTKAGVRDALFKTLSGDLGAILGRSAEVIAGHLGVHVMKIGTDLLQRASKLLGLGGRK